FSFPAYAAHVHGTPDGGPVSDYRHHGADAGDPGELPVGHVSAQPRRAHAGNGHRRGARLHVSSLRDRSARAHQSWHSPPACPAGGRITAEKLSCLTRCCSPCQARPSSITVMRSVWATIFISAIAMAAARRCNGARTATRDSQEQIRNSFIC